jgi:murein DD-endopeptidase MepM/ murein hydrolase activator NlpD
MPNFHPMAIFTAALALVALIGYPLTQSFHASSSAPVDESLADAPPERQAVPPSVDSVQPAPQPAVSPLPTVVSPSTVPPDDVPAQAEAVPDTDPVQPATKQPLSVVEKVRRGDTLGKILTRIGAPSSQAALITDALRPHWDPKSLKPGTELSFSIDPESVDPDDRLLGLSIRAGADRDITIDRRDARFVATVHARILTTVETALAGTITTSFYRAGQAAGLPTSVLHQLFGLFAYDVDFQRDLQPGDRFDVLFDSVLDPDGALVRAGPIKAASLTLSGTVLRLYRHQFSDGSAEWFTPKGDSVKKTLLRTPIDGARLTSGFGPRNHPILGYTSQHMGVDFGAPTGSPIMAAGDGVVERADWFGGYGNYVRLRHTPEISTAYGHMVRHAPGIRPGVRVKQGQIIGYVGSTGMSTGPHLHFEVHQGGRPINPQNVKSMPGRRLEPGELKRFRDQIVELDRRMAKATSGNLLNAKAP